jgi:alkanesulfonate monooxygenase SsuD/methylene tetrahydromethanopterin reductase-like flavin-dependent oxidoreductase (luciferase family)
VEYGAVLPTLAMFGGALPNLGGLLEYARAAEDAGYTSVWAADHVLHQDPGYYAPVCLQAVAMAAPKLRVGFATMPAFLQHPLYAAKILSTLERLTGGQLEAAFSIGDERPEMRALGIDPRERGGRLDETLAVLDLLRRGGAVSFTGRYYQFEGVRIEPPLSLPPANVYVASWTGTKALERIFRHGAGWMASGLFSRREDLERGVAALREEASRRGAPLPRTVMTNVLTFISDNEGAVEQAQRALADPDGSLSGARGVRLIGSLEAVGKRLRYLASLGFERLNVLPVEYDAAQLAAFMTVARSLSEGP